MSDKQTPSQFVILREADGSSRLIESERVDFTEFKFLKSGPVDGLPKAMNIDEWCHESVFDTWCQQLVNDLFNSRDKDRDSF
jgi:hypothetical protein